MKIYFEETGWAALEEGPRVELTAYVSPKEHSDGYEGYEYDMCGKRHPFEWVNPDEARVFDSSELPEEMLYSFKHGVNEFTVEESKARDYKLTDLKYDKVDRKKIQSTMKGVKLIDGCKTLDDVYDVWVKYIKDAYMPFVFVQKGLAIIGHAEQPMVNGELGFYGMANSLRFYEIMTNEYYKRAGRKEQKIGE